MTMQVSSAETRIMRFLKAGGCELQDSVRDTHVLLVGEQGTIAAARHEIESMCARGILRAHDSRIALAASTRDRGAARRKVARPVVTRTTETVELEPGERVEVNPAESPLAMLFRRKNQDGETFICEDEFRAGERLRADFTRGQLMPSVTSRWDGSVGGCGRSGAGGVAELTDIALASRIRVERALEAVGPELSGVLLDVCCFLKGLETVERERHWPVRSAKVLLKAGLAMLHRHYNPPRESDTRKGVVLHWGSADYRPSVRPG
ncbi:hypothetical protein H7Q97_04775 [Ochrobactrum sp. CM-21-5]|nr:hypothetical protein [Ochrobactrum sp. CM-21-5]